MAYQTGTSSSATDLLSQLATFAAANGWTIDDAVGSNKFALHKNDIWISFRLDTSLTSGSQVVGIHHALGHTPGGFPGTHPGDSNSGYNFNTSVVGTTLDNERYVDLGRSSDEIDNAYHFFEQDASPAYIHVVIARSDGQHRHFGFGEIDKFGAWTGGEYCYGHSTSTSGSSMFSDSDVILLDGVYDGSSTQQNEGGYPTLHIESFADQPAASKWAEVGAARASATANDNAGNPRMKVQGGYRAGPIMNGLGNIGLNKASGFINLIPIALWAYFAKPDPVADSVYFLGYQPDVRGIVLNGIAPGEELNVGSDTWVCFPSREKSTESGSTLSQYQGIAYRKVTA